MLSCVKRLLGGRLCRTASPHDQMLQPAAIHMEYGVDYTLGGILGGFHKHASGSVAEKRACGAVLIVDHRRHFFRGNDHDFLAETALYICVGIFERYDEACAGGLNIVGISILKSRALADYRCGGRETIVGVGCRADKQVDFSGIRSGIGQQFFHRLDAHIA